MAVFHCDVAGQGVHPLLVGSRSLRASMVPVVVPMIYARVLLILRLMWFRRKPVTLVPGDLEKFRELQYYVWPGIFLPYWVGKFLYRHVGYTN